MWQTALSFIRKIRPISFHDSCFCTIAYKRPFIVTERIMQLNKNFVVSTYPFSFYRSFLCSLISLTLIRFWVLLVRFVCLWASSGLYLTQSIQSTSKNIFFLISKNRQHASLRIVTRQCTGKRRKHWMREIQSVWSWWMMRDPDMWTPLSVKHSFHSSYLPQLSLFFKFSEMTMHGLKVFSNLFACLIN